MNTHAEPGSASDPHSENSRDDEKRDETRDAQHDDDKRTEAKVRERESREKTPTRTERSLTQEERESVLEHGRLSALAVYSIILREGEEELRRPKTSLWWSGVAAGIGISTSVLVEGILRAKLGADHAYLSILESIGYTFGFVLVILSRLQLFTENTITVVLPILAEPTRDRFYCSARLWGIVFVANMVGTFVTAAIAVHGGVMPEEVLGAILDISRHLAEFTPFEAMLRGIPSGFFIAALVWMLPSAKGSELLLIMLFTWLIAAGDFTHVVAGSNEIFSLVLAGEMSFFTAFTHSIFPVLIGNIIGGTGLFAMLAYGQIHEEM
ncbi:formate/nitrite transporter family protein [Oceaniglobus roseus]|uniref:formate/nitrite transporter family protein n=1 Tax=Oceaniglobus roseus TaxID=1737570 RepID=UPI000C7F28E1|nr:formate/nitrite transporter family protein [Kandeliimicrobium roseum]